MEPVTIIGKYLIGTVTKKVLYQHIYGLSPKEHLKTKLELIIQLYEKHKSITPDLISALTVDDLEKIAQRAGVYTVSGMILSAVLSNRNPAELFFESETYKILTNYEYFTVELGKRITDKDMVQFIVLAKEIKLSL